MEHVDQARRDEALAVLQRHWDARTIDPGEHERRTTLVRRAQTPGEVDAAVGGLPALPVGGVRSAAPIAPWQGAPVEPASTASGASSADRPAAGSDLERRDDGRTRGIIKVPTEVGDTLQVLVPLLCVGAFFVLHTGWPVFLLIPIVMVLIHGGSKNDDTADEGASSKHARRELKRRHRRERR